MPIAISCYGLCRAGKEQARMNTVHTLYRFNVGGSRGLNDGTYATFPSTRLFLIDSEVLMAT